MIKSQVTAKIHNGSVSNNRKDHPVSPPESHPSYPYGQEGTGLPWKANVWGGGG
jgi:hypothetical protein